MRHAFYSVYFILSLLLLVTCISHTPSEKTQTSLNSFPLQPGKWWYTSYTTTDCSTFYGFSAYTEVTGKIKQINDTAYFEMLWITNPDYKASKRGMLKDKQMSMVGVRHEAGKYFLHSDLLAEQGFGEQLLFDTKASIGDKWTMKWKSRYVSYDFALKEKNYNAALADTVYTFSAKASLTASHVPEIISMLFSPKFGLIAHQYEDTNGEFMAIREDIAPNTLLKSCD